jgi:hypothetical protein
MTDLDTTLRTALRDAEEKLDRDHVPDFDSTWAAAERHVGSTRKRRGAIAGALVAAAVGVVAIGLLPPGADELRYIDTEDLLGTTYWLAPSDSLLPVHRFDIYQDIPVLIESTETYGGALL